MNCVTMLENFKMNYVVPNTCACASTVTCTFYFNYTHFSLAIHIAFNVHFPFYCFIQSSEIYEGFSNMLCNGK